MMGKVYEAILTSLACLGEGSVKIGEERRRATGRIVYLGGTGNGPLRLL
jgi:hypothetical protein